MPFTTLEAVADHGRIDEDTVTGRADLSAETLELLSGVGADVDDVDDTLEREGVDKFAASWGATRPGPADAGQGPQLGSGTLILPGGAHRVRRLSGSVDVLAGADDASHQRLHW